MSNKNKGPGPIRRALFQDVPFILDSIWRRSEFDLHRVGNVSLDNPNPLVLRPAWMCMAFVLFVLVSLFAVFGPTLDAMCSVADFGFAGAARTWTGYFLIAVAVVAFFVVLNATTWRLTRNAEAQADQICASDPEKQALRARLQKLVDSKAFKSEWLRAFAGTFAEHFTGNVVNLGVASVFLSWWERIGLLVAFLTLMAGTVLLVAPVFVTGLTMGYIPLDPASCTQEPNKGLVYAQIAAFALLVVGGFFIWRHWGARRAVLVFFASTALLVAVVALLWWQFTPGTPSEAAGGFYPHVYLVLLGILLGVAAAARVLAWWMFRKVPVDTCQLFAGALHREDLLQDERPLPDVSWLRLFSAAVTGVFGHLLHFLLLPAFVAFMAPSTMLVGLVLGFAAVSAVLLMYATLSARWAQMLIHIDRWFLVGTPMVVSLLVILIGIARLANFQYVTTVLDATPTGVLFIIMVMLYVAAWFFEFWINHWVGDELLGLLGDRKLSRKGYLSLQFNPHPEARCWAERNGRYVALHSTGRFLALGWFMKKDARNGEKDKGVAFSTFGFAELFYALGAKQQQGIDMAHDIERRVRVYFGLINIALVVLMAVAVDAAIPLPLAVKPMVSEQTVLPGYDAPVVDALGARLTAQSAAGRPSIVVAASGGGTRAAVYTAVALEGVAQIDRARDIVLLSGVSGGGVSAAVFASRFEELTTTRPGAPVPGGRVNPWDEYVSVVSAPYIQDVLEGIGELRIAGTTSLGALLQESLEHRAFAAHPRTFGAIKGPTLILNSAVSGHPYEDSQLMAGRIAGPRTQNCVEVARPYANLAGGRLVFTNLKNVSGFPQPPKQPETGLSDDPPDMWLPYSIVNIDAVPLAAASALTANFPPVFSNARVRLFTEDKVTCPRSYFVTDGGATENLGLVSALYALRGSVQDLPEGAKISDIHVLAFEASAIDYDYSDDRGIGAATGGSKERLNAGLTQMLLDDVRGLVGARGAKLHVHYLPLPVAFRSRGGFGTHWMFAPHIRLANPHVASMPDSSMFKRASETDFVVLERKEVMSTMRGLFDPDEPVCARAERVRQDPAGAATDAENGWTVNVQHVARWICGFDDERGTKAKKPDYQVEAWAHAVKELTVAELKVAAD
ncbi:MAG TPA: hypothetical protein VFU13_16640 [Steroidobacteraceae bacterium]|nr:hypothetical protein [Steroidobacteraceae bacterium]